MEQLPSLAFMSSASSFFAYGDAWSTILWITSLTFVLFIVAPSACWVWNRLKKNNRKTRFFYYLIAAVAIIGATWSFLLPIAIDSGFRKDDDGPVLRQILLYATGGLLGVITLGETHRKNNQEKEKNENDHTRQVHAERRSRYTKAVEQLANENAAVRLGGIYTLVGLVDEWITDETLTPENQQKEGQVIINSLCSYIRSPFSLAIDGNIMAYDGINYDMPPEDYEGDYRGDQARLIDEQDTRISIFKEISSRINDEILNKSNQKHWNNFSYNFSRSVIFYPLRNLSFSEADFSFAIFIGDTGFDSSQFLRKISFAGGRFNDEITFNNTYFNNGADFSYTTFEAGADFVNSKSTGCVSFESSRIFCDIDFSNSKFSCNCEHNWKFIRRQDGPKLQYGFASLLNLNNEVITRILPAGSCLFDPDSWDEEKQKYTRVSAPAKPPGNSDAEEEKPAK
ncbi:pentapeptide repeat-containing protein [Rothia sp. 27098_8_29]|jgi:hypothetical protein|uniref:pentapeptide repeat-containing protein n=1 Tax=Rothia sp. 27098_8_29 TaxID=3003676 RepID=UPI00352EC2B5